MEGKSRTQPETLLVRFSQDRTRRRSKDARAATTMMETGSGVQPPPGGFARDVDDCVHPFEYPIVGLSCLTVPGDLTRAVDGPTRLLKCSRLQSQSAQTHGSSIHQRRVYPASVGVVDRRADRKAQARLFPIR